MVFWIFAYCLRLLKVFVDNRSLISRKNKKSCPKTLGQDCNFLRYHLNSSNDALFSRTLCNTHLYAVRYNGRLPSPLTYHMTNRRIFRFKRLGFSAACRNTLGLPSQAHSSSPHIRLAPNGGSLCMIKEDYSPCSTVFRMLYYSTDIPTCQ